MKWQGSPEKQVRAEWLEKATEKEVKAEMWEINQVREKWKTLYYPIVCLLLVFVAIIAIWSVFGYSYNSILVEKYEATYDEVLQKVCYPSKLSGYYFQNGNLVVHCSNKNIRIEDKDT